MISLVVLALLFLVGLVLALIGLFGTTQTGSVTFYSSDKVNTFSGTITDDAWKLVYDQVATASNLGDVMAGKIITHYRGVYAAGGGLFRIRNKVTGEIVAMQFMDLTSGAQLRPLDRPVYVRPEYVVDIFTVAVPT